MSVEDELREAVVATCRFCDRPFLTREALSGHDCGASEDGQLSLSEFEAGGRR